MRIYVASSWRNRRQPKVVSSLREIGHEVYDFRNPSPGDTGFAWSDIDEGWQDWTAEEFTKHIDHPIVKRGYMKDADAMVWADAFVLVMPCGRSAHLEAGWGVGQGKSLAILLDDGEPELMYRMATSLVTNLDDLLSWARAISLDFSSPDAP